jgi:hypothetical protein
MAISSKRTLARNRFRVRRRSGIIQGPFYQRMLR